MTGASILLVEDDPWFAEQQYKILSKSGFLVRHVTNGLAAIEEVEDSLPDLLVLDFFLPGPNGMALLHEMQSYADLSAVPVIVCTSSAADVPEGGLKPYGVRKIVDKCTMHPNELAVAARAVLS
jgi:two-component system NtrC family sensor kinase